MIPETISQLSFYLLVGLSFFTSLLSAAIGIGGGAIMLGVMAQIIPINAIIPVHALVQFGSNFGRATVLASYINKQYLLWFVIGSLIGAAIGGQFVNMLSSHWLKLILGLFLLFMVWGKALISIAASKKNLFTGGLLSTVLTMFAGATGPFVFALFKQFSLQKEQIVSTSAACLVIQHSMKIVVFGLLGFAFTNYAILIILMIATGFAGTIVGRKILLRIDVETFQKVLDIVLVLLSIKLIMEVIVEVIASL